MRVWIPTLINKGNNKIIEHRAIFLEDDLTYFFLLEKYLATVYFLSYKNNSCYMEYLHSKLFELQFW
jgi:hypothetical protein